MKENLFVKISRIGGCRDCVTASQRHSVGFGCPLDSILTILNLTTCYEAFTSIETLTVFMGTHNGQKK